MVTIQSQKTLIRCCFWI